MGCDGRPSTALTGMTASSLSNRMRRDATSCSSMKLPAALESISSGVQVTRGENETFIESGAVSILDGISNHEELSDSQTQLDEMKTKYSEMESRLKSTELQVEKLKAENEERKVAFSVALGIGGYYSGDTILVYKDIFTNIGNHYNELNGVFTAPVNGVYYFRVALFGIVERNSGIHCNLRKNGIITLMAGLWEYIAISQHHVVNAASLLLEKGDRIDVQLQGTRIYDDSHKRNTLSGFLLFPMGGSDYYDP
ncbi:hypothetical protein UPYG_G00048250 [Umbra pygmaea]|uniref:C1q domain-containing protein n=1 Tax=Umbra pygmaea TaxID=75934 RepID=A0ABD0YF92_UMBPY